MKKIILVLLVFSIFATGCLTTTSTTIKNKNAVAEDIKLSSEDAEGYYKRAMAYFKAVQNVKAVEDLDKAIELDPNHIEALFERGRWRMFRGKYDKAIEDLNKAIELDPNHIRAYRWRGKTYENLNQYDMAIKDLQFVCDKEEDKEVSIYKNNGCSDLRRVIDNKNYEEAEKIDAKRHEEAIKTRKGGN